MPTLAPLVLAVSLAAPSANDLLAEFPGARVIAAGRSGRTAHASGFVAPGLGRTPEESARRFITDHDAAFGVSSRISLVTRATRAPGEVGAVRFERNIDGLPVFGGDLVVGIDAAGSVFLVNSADVPPDTAGRFVLSYDDAVNVVTSALGPGPRLAGVPAVAKGWKARGNVTRPVYRVDVATSLPAGEWRFIVDADSGAVLWRKSLRKRVQGSVYPISPSEDASSQCSVVTGTTGTPPQNFSEYDDCKQPITVDLPNLDGSGTLSGTHTKVYQCAGQDPPDTAANIPGNCKTVISANASGANANTFIFPADTTFKSPTDDFAGAMAYYHVDKHVSFLASLDPTATHNLTTLPSFVNAFSGGKPFDNAFFSPQLQGMVFGQGVATDYAYDAEVIYHELTHGAIDSFGGLDPDYDQFGIRGDPGALNEATADAMALSESSHDAQLGEFIARSFNPPELFIRDLSGDPVMKTCKGSGTSQDRGLVGEVHDDGEVWGETFWEMHTGLTSATGCKGKCDAAAQIQYHAMELSAGTSPTFEQYALDMVSAAKALQSSGDVTAPNSADVSAYVDCVQKRHAIPDCNNADPSGTGARLVPTYQGETHPALIEFGFGTFQYVFNVTGSNGSGGGVLQACVSSAGATQKYNATLYLKKGSPVTLNLGGSATTIPTVTSSDAQGTIQTECGSGQADTISIPSTGTWYALIHAPGLDPTPCTGSPGTLCPVNDSNVYALKPSTGFGTRPAATALCTCALGGNTTCDTGSSGSGSSSKSGCGCGGGPGGALALVPILFLARRRIRTR